MAIVEGDDDVGQSVVYKSSKQRRAVSQDPAKLHAAPTTPEKEFEPNPRLLVIETLMFTAVVAIGGLVTYEVVGLRTEVTPRPLLELPGLLEAEVLPVVDKVGNLITMAQDTSTFKQGQWSGGKHLFAAGRSKGDALTLRLPGQPSGSYDLTVYLTKSFDYGVVQISVNGEEIGPRVDLWSFVVESTGPVRLGTVTLKGEGDVIGFQVVGKNDRATAPFFQFGIDGILLGSTQ